MHLAFLARDGVFSAAHARQLGVGSSALRRFVQAGKAFPLHRGWYAVRPALDERDRHGLRTTALLQEYAGNAVACHGSALVRLGLPTERVDFGTVHLMWVGPDVSFRAYSRVRMHEAISAVALPRGADTVHAALAIVQAGLLDVRSLLVAGDAALRQGTVTRSQLRAATSALRGQRGLIRARAAVEWCDARHESAGETMTAYLLRHLGYAFEPQFEPGSTGPLGAPERADFRITGTRVLVEFDGRQKYAADTSEQARDLLFAEKKREDGFRRRGYEVVRVVWADHRHPEQVRTRIEAARRRAQWRSAG